MKLGHKKVLEKVLKQARADMKEQEKDRKLEEELPEIERKRKLHVAQVKSTRAQQLDVDEHSEADAKVSSQMQAWSFVMPPGTDHFAFLSHKKTNSKTGNVTETLALRVCDFRSST